MVLNEIVLLLIAALLSLKLSLAQTYSLFSRNDRRNCDEEILLQFSQQNVSFSFGSSQEIIVTSKNSNSSEESISLFLSQCQISSTIVFKLVESLDLDFVLNEVYKDTSNENFFITVEGTTNVKVGRLSVVETQGKIISFKNILNLSFDEIICSQCSDVSLNDINTLSVSSLSLDRNLYLANFVINNIGSIEIQTLKIKQVYGNLLISSNNTITIANLVYSKDPVDQEYRIYPQKQLSDQPEPQIKIICNEILTINIFEVYYIPEIFHISAGTIQVDYFKYESKQSYTYLREGKNQLQFYSQGPLNFEALELINLKYDDNILRINSEQEISVNEFLIQNCVDFQIRITHAFVTDMYYSSKLSIDNDSDQLSTPSDVFLIDITHFYIGDKEDSQLNNQVNLSFHPEISFFNWTDVMINTLSNIVDAPISIKLSQINWFIINDLILNYVESQVQFDQPFIQANDIQDMLIAKAILNLNFGLNVPFISVSLAYSVMFSSFQISNIGVYDKFAFDFLSVSDVTIIDFEVNGACYNKGLVLVKDVENFAFNSSQITIQKDTKSCVFHDQRNDYFSQAKMRQNLFQYEDFQPSFVVLEQLVRIPNFSRGFKYLIADVTANFNEINSRMVDARKITMPLSFERCSFSNMHTIQNGGCLRLQNINVMDLQTIYNTTLVNCHSENFGGAIFGANLVAMSKVNITDCYAPFAGAFFASSFSYNLNVTNTTSKQLTKSLFQLDSLSVYKIIEFNEDIAQLPSIIESYDTDKTSTYKLKPGVKYIFLIEICLKLTDKPEDFISKVRVECSKINQNQYGNLYYYINQTLTREEDIEIKESFLPQSISLFTEETYLVFQPKSNKIYSTITLQFLQRFNLKLPVQQTNCSIGQYYNYINENSYLCQFCPDKTASYNSDNQRVCVQCDPKYFSNCYGNYSQINQNYYRELLTLDQTLIYNCNQYSFCVGGSGFGNSLCSEGRVGFECTSCDIHGTYWNEPYSQSGYFTCTKCSSIANNQVKIILLLIGVVIFMFLVIHSNTKNIINVIAQHYLSRMGMIYLGKSFQNLGQSSVYIKIFSFNASMMYFIQQQLNINWRGLLLDQQMQFSDPLKMSAVSLDCAIKETYPQYRDVGFMKLGFYLLLPLIILPIAFTPLLVKMIFKKITKKQFFYTISLTCIYVLFISFYNPILSICLDALLCRKFSNQKKHSFLDLTKTCDEAQKYKQYALVGIILYSILVPLITIFGLIKNKYKLKKISTLLTFGFLYRDYKHKYYYWEFMRFSVKISILVIQKIFFENLYFMNCLNIIFLLSYLIPLIILQPFAISNMNKIEMISVCIIVFGFFSLIVFSNENNTNGVFLIQSQVMLYLSLGFSVLFIIYLSICIIVSLFETQLLKLQRYRVFSFLLARCSIFNKHQNQKRLHSNLNKFRVLVKRIIGNEILFVNQKQQSLNDYEDCNYLDDEATLIVN